MGHLHQDMILEEMRQYLSALIKLPPSEWEAFSPHLRYRLLQKGDHFIRAGEVSQEVAYIHQGLLRMYCVTREGEEYNKLFKFERDLIGGLRSLLSGAPSLLSIEALEPTQLMVVPYSLIREFYGRHWAWQELGRKVAEKEFLVKEKREDQFLFQSAKERYLEFLKDYPALKGRIPQYHLAQYLGITPEALSRLVKNLGR